MINRKIKYLNEMGINVWIKKEISVDLNFFKEKVSNCTSCILYKNRNNTVFGIGNENNAQVMFIGEAPGENEDLQGKPFVGVSGLLFDKQLKSINLDRNEIYITNILKCRPPNNRVPSIEEINACSSYLIEQINIIKPKILVAVGKTAAQFLLNTNEPIGKLRLKIHQYKNKLNKILLLVTYHPSYLLRSPYKKKDAFIDFLLIKNVLNNYKK